jgi:alanine dehydrogenase
MTGEGRVALVPAACAQLVNAGHTVLVETGAGLGSGYSDADYAEAGVSIVADAEALYASADLIVKVKQPLGPALQYLKAHHTVFSYLHLAPQPELTRQLCDIGLTAIAFETYASDGHHPLLAPMSAIAGRLAVIDGANCLLYSGGGRGVLLGGITGSEPGKVVVIGIGVAGAHAVRTAHSLGADVVAFDLDTSRLGALHLACPGIRTITSTPQAIADELSSADLVVGAVMRPGRRAPVVVTETMIDTMQTGSVIVDIAIDQGGCVENIHSTSYREPTYVHKGVMHYAVPNMPGGVPRTASQALSSAVLPHVFELLEKGVEASRVLSAMAVSGGHVIDPVLREELGL